MPSYLASSSALCLHCAQPVATGETDFCCVGCKAVYGLLHSEGLEKYYDLGVGRTASRLGEPEDTKWLSTLLAQRPDAGPWALELGLGGIHCSACVWAIETLFRRAPGALSCAVNPSLGRADLVVLPEFDLPRFVQTVRGLGYTLGTVAEVTREGGDHTGLLWRVGVALALAMNVMIFSLATYTGLESGETYKLFQAIAFGLSSLSMLVGAPVFLVSAWRAARSGVAHLDQPIALGMVLAYVSSTLSYVRTGGKDAYFDTLAVFVALMLLGRFLQTRAVERNRAALLGSDGIDGLLVRKWNEGAPVVAPCADVRRGDELLIARGDVVPTAARVAEGEAQFSLDWVSGESAPRAFGQNDTIPAGAFLGQAEAVRVVATEDFASSHLLALLRKSHVPMREMSRVAPFYQRLTSSYVVGVYALALGALAYWGPRAGADKTISVMASLLIVTCPCAFGIAVPLAFEWAQTRLRERGVFVRSPSLLERAARVRGIVFDKTGTLTTGRPKAHIAWSSPSPEHLDALYTLAASSAHPKARAIVDALGTANYLAELRVRETMGVGLRGDRAESHYKLGEAQWAAGIAGDMAFSLNGDLLATITTSEELRHDAVTEVQRLRSMGLSVTMLSGDRPARVEEIAAALSIPHAFGAQRPEDKEAWVRARADDALMMIGDGINDGMAADAAYASGTPAAESPFMAARTDFYFLSPGIRPVREVIRMAQRLDGTVKYVLALAMTYNVLTVGLALSGRMSPLLCAVVMPLSSLSTIALAGWRLSERNTAWT